MTNYRDTWAVDEEGNKFVFTVEMKRRLERAGLPIEPDYLGQLRDNGRQSAPPRSSSRPAPMRQPEPEPDDMEPAVIQIDPATGKYLGRLKWYNPARGYGFISRGGGEDIFFHKSSSLNDPTTLEEGQWVLYDVEERKKGPEATEVEPYTGEVE